ncbi:MAG: hypothetical protein ACREKH_11175, partial [Candidatus Rokuibacteriota bacterium]
MKLVMKFGGSSVADAERMRRCARILKDHAAQHKVVAIVSALDGVTEELLALAEAAGAANHPVMQARMNDLRRKHDECARVLGDGSLTASILD